MRVYKDAGVEKVVVPAGSTSSILVVDVANGYVDCNYVKCCLKLKVDPSLC